MSTNALLKLNFGRKLEFEKSVIFDIRRKKKAILRYLCFSKVVDNVRYIVKCGVIKG